MQTVSAQKMIKFILEYQSKNILILFYISMVLVSYFLFVSPGQSYTTIWLSDTIALLDASYRVSIGQVPGKDFFTAIGPLNFYFSSLGLIFDFDPSVTFALGGIVTLCILLLAGMVMMYSRFSLIPILIVSLYFGLLIASPLDSGDTYRNSTWGMFYNRQAWAALFFVFLFYVEPKNLSVNKKYLDGTLLAILVIFELYCKITFGLIALAFVFANMFVSKYNRNVSLVSLAVMLLLIALVEISLQLNEGYFDSIVRAINSRSAVRANLWGFVDLISKHAAIISAAFLSLVYMSILGRKKLLDWLFVIGGISACILLLDQNGGLKGGMPAIFALFMCLMELNRRSVVLINSDKEGVTEISTHLVVSSSIFLLLVTFISKPLLHRVLGAQDYYVKIKTHEPSDITPPLLKNFLVPSIESNLFKPYLNNEPVEMYIGEFRVKLNDTLSTPEYFLSIADGYNFLRSQNLKEQVLFVLDLADPFTFALQLTPRANGYPFKWAWPSDTSKKVFKNVTIVMQPRLPYHEQSHLKFKEKYNDYLKKHYTMTASSQYWYLWEKN